VELEMSRERLAAADKLGAAPTTNASLTIGSEMLKFLTGRGAKRSPDERPVDPMEGLAPGRIVCYVFDDVTANDVNSTRHRLGIHGTPVCPGDRAGAIVVAVVAYAVVNLTVFLDGPDTYWAKSVRYAEATPGHWMFARRPPALPSDQVPA
jgi:hypothetical protein